MFRLKSVPTTFRQLAEMPGGRRRTNPQQKSTRVRAVSSGSKLAVLELKHWHLLTMIHDELTSKMYKHRIGVDFAIDYQKSRAGR